MKSNIQEKAKRYKSNYVQFFKENMLSSILIIISFAVFNVLNIVLLKSYDDGKRNAEIVPLTVFLIISVFIFLTLSLSGIFIIARKNKNSIIKALFLFVLLAIVSIAILSLLSGFLSRLIDVEYRTLNTTKSIVDNFTSIIGIPIKAYFYCLLSVVVIDGSFKLKISGRFYIDVFILTLIMSSIDLLFITINYNSIIVTIIQAVINTIFLSVIFIFTFSYDKNRYMIRKINKIDNE